MQDLMRRNIIASPVAGTAAAVDPIYQSRAIPGAQSAYVRLKQSARDLMKDAWEDDEDVQKAEDPSPAPDAIDANQTV